MSTQPHETAQLKKAPNQLRPKMKAFLAAYRETGNITRAVLMAKVSRRRHYGQLEGKAYREAFEDAQEHAVETLEEEARRRAISGSNSLYSTREKFVDRFVNTLMCC